MEYLVLHYLDWRIRTPTAHTFLQLLCSSMDVGVDEAKEATYFTVGVAPNATSSAPGRADLVRHPCLAYRQQLPC